MRVQFGLMLATGLAIAPFEAIAGQSGSRSTVSADSERQANEAAVNLSGVWDMDGEYNGKTGIFDKATGYFAYVSSTPTSADDGDVAVLSMFLQPMAGGNSHWVGARLSCLYRASRKRTECLPTDGSSSLLEVNFIVSGLLIRGIADELVIEEPDDKNGETRFSSNSTSRGKLQLTRPKL